jgi:cell division protein FtsQ
VNTKGTIRRILFVGLWLVIGSGMLMLLIAAIGKQKKETCKDYEIVIKGAQPGDLFLEKSDVVRLLKGATRGNVKGQSKKAFNLQQIEQLLEENVWVKEARLYFDNHEVLHVSVTERVPVARVFTAGGKSFYIDDEGQHMQLSDKVSARLPVFTGYPDAKKARQDSLLGAQIISTAKFITADSFWSAQVSQLDISSCGATCWEFDMIPLVGNHIVKLGNGDEMPAKFARLMTFYKQVLSKSGFDAYRTIDVRYTGQVVGGKSLNPKVDAQQLKKSVDAMLQQIKAAEAASDAAIAGGIKTDKINNN